MFFSGEHLKLQSEPPFFKSIGPFVYDLGGGVKTNMNIKKNSDNHFVFNDESDNCTCTGDMSSMLMGVEDPTQHQTHVGNSQVIGLGGPQLMDAGAENYATGSVAMQTNST